MKYTELRAHILLVFGNAWSHMCSYSSIDGKSWPLQHLSCLSLIYAEYRKHRQHAEMIDKNEQYTCAYHMNELCVVPLLSVAPFSL